MAVGRALSGMATPDYCPAWGLGACTKTLPPACRLFPAPPPQMAARLAALPRLELAAAVTEALTGPPHYPPRPQLGSLLSGLLAAPRTTQFVEPPAVTDVVGADPKAFPLTLQHAGV